MNKFIGFAAASLMALLCVTGCGSGKENNSSSVKVSVEAVNNKTLDELHRRYQGTWEVSVVCVDNHDGIKFDIDRYKFNEDGTGLFIPQNSKREDVSWSVTPEGDLQVIYKDQGDKTVEFEYVGGNLVSSVKEDRGIVETHLAKSADINSSPDTNK